MLNYFNGSGDNDAERFAMVICCSFLVMCVAIPIQEARFLLKN